METCPLAVWLWNALTARQVPIVCMDARHASGVLKMMPDRTDRHDARGRARIVARIVRTGWFKAGQIKSRDAHVDRVLLAVREAPVGMRVRLENEIRGLLKTSGVMFGETVGGFMRRAEEIIARDPAVAPELSSRRSCGPGATFSPASPRWTAGSGRLPGSMPRGGR